MNRFLLFIIIVVVQVFVVTSPVRAGFGVSPPYISSDKIRPGVRYEQTINLLRSNTESKLNLQMIIDAPEIADWVSFEGGDTTSMSIGKSNKKLTVYIDVPENADLGNYQGKVIVKTKSSDDTGAMINISTGAEININFDLVDELYNEIVVKNASIADYSIGTGFISKIYAKFSKLLKIDLQLENIGNVDTSLSKVIIDIYDIKEREQLVSLSDVEIDEVKAFETSQVEASFKAFLDVGQYWGNIKVYQGNKIIYTNKLAFTVERGEIGYYYKIIFYLFIIIFILILVLGFSKILRRKH